jgi:hypothetical protein
MERKQHTSGATHDASQKETELAIAVTLRHQEVPKSTFSTQIGEMEVPRRKFGWRTLR